MSYFLYDYTVIEITFKNFKIKISFEINTMKVSIITSCYNREKTIRGAVESVLAEDYPDSEYIIVDGASNLRTSLLRLSVRQSPVMRIR